MMLVEETSVPSVALPVEEFRAHLRLGSGFSNDSLQDSVLESFLWAAMAAIEARTGKVLIAREYSWELTRWRDRDQQVLPVAPVTEILAVTVSDRTGGQSVGEAQEYRLVQDHTRPRVRANGARLPVIPTDASIKLRFVAGFGPGWNDLPADLRQAVLLLAAHYYEYRHETTLHGGCMPFGVTSLIERHRPVRMYLGGGQ